MTDAAFDTTIGMSINKFGLRPAYNFGNAFSLVETGTLKHAQNFSASDAVGGPAAQSLAYATKSSEAGVTQD